MVPSSQPNCLPSTFPSLPQVGPRDVEQGTCVVARRDVPGKEGKQFGVPMEEGAFVAHVQVGWGLGQMGGGAVCEDHAWPWCTAALKDNLHAVCTPKASEPSCTVLANGTLWSSTPPPPHLVCLQGLLEDVQASLLREAREFRDANIVDVSSYEELQAAVAEGALPEGEGAGGGLIHAGDGGLGTHADRGQLAACSRP